MHATLTTRPRSARFAARHRRAGLVIATAAVAALSLAVSSGVALAASPKPGPSPGTLWKQYPLNPKQASRGTEPAAPAARASTSERFSAPQAGAAGNGGSDDARLALARVLFFVALAFGGVATLLLVGLVLARPSEGLPSFQFPRPPPLRRAVGPVGRSFGHAGESLGHAAGSVGHAAGSLGRAARSLGRLAGEAAPGPHSRRALAGAAIWYLATALVSIGAALLVFRLRGP